jgi:hypothetical protein
MLMTARSADPPSSFLTGNTGPPETACFVNVGGCRFFRDMFVETSMRHVHAQTGTIRQTRITLPCLGGALPK